MNSQPYDLKPCVCVGKKKCANATKKQIAKLPIAMILGIVRHNEKMYVKK